MTFEEFRDMVADLRTRQRAYFRLRSIGALKSAQAAEKAVDRVLIELAEPRWFSLGDRKNAGPQEGDARRVDSAPSTVPATVSACENAGEL